MWSCVENDVRVIVTFGTAGALPESAQPLSTQFAVLRHVQQILRLQGSGRPHDRLCPGDQDCKDAFSSYAFAWLFLASHRRSSTTCTACIHGRRPKPYHCASQSGQGAPTNWTAGLPRSSTSSVKDGEYEERQYRPSSRTGHAPNVCTRLSSPNQEAEQKVGAQLRWKRRRAMKRTWLTHIPTALSPLEIHRPSRNRPLHRGVRPPRPKHHPMEPTIPRPRPSIYRRFRRIHNSNPPIRCNR